jgi:hypothetical protein
VLNGDCGGQELGRNFLKRVKGHFANEWGVVTPNGQYLTHDLAEGLKKWKALAADERRKLDKIGAYDPAQEPTPPKGGLILQVYSRALTAIDGKFAPYKTEVSRSWEPGRDFVWLTEEEWRSLVPTDLKAGQRHEIPAAIQMRLVRRYLIDLVRVGGNGGPRRSEEILKRKMTLMVERADAATVRMWLAGSARVATNDVGSGAKDGNPKIDDYDVTGRITYDMAKKAITQFDLVAFSPTGHHDEIRRKTLPFGVAFERLEGKTPAERSPPSSWGENYFAADGR